MKSSARWLARSMAVSGIVLLLGLGFTGEATSQTSFTRYRLATSAGIWVVTANTGAISFCAALKSAAGAPQGRCVPIGNTGMNYGWAGTGDSYSLTAVGTDLMIVDNLYQTIYQCAVTVTQPSSVAGSCKVIGHMSQL